MSETTNEAWRKVASEIGQPTATDAPIGMFKPEPGPDPAEEAFRHDAEIEGAMRKLSENISNALFIY